MGFTVLLFPSLNSLGIARGPVRKDSVGAQGSIGAPLDAKSWKSRGWGALNHLLDHVMLTANEAKLTAGDMMKETELVLPAQAG